MDHILLKLFISPLRSTFNISQGFLHWKKVFKDLFYTLADPGQILRMFKEMSWAKKAYCHSVATYEAQLTEVTFKSMSKWPSNVWMEQPVTRKLYACTLIKQAFLLLYLQKRSLYNDHFDDWLTYTCQISNNPPGWRTLNSCWSVNVGSHILKCWVWLHKTIYASLCPNRNSKQKEKYNYIILSNHILTLKLQFSCNKYIHTLNTRILSCT